MPSALIQPGTRSERSPAAPATGNSARRPDRPAASARFTVLVPALASALLLWAAFPPLDLWPLAWVAPLGWLWLCRQPILPGRRPWLAIWISGFLFWLAELHWLRLPHPATAIGWVALSFYFAFYIPAFIWLTRRATRVWRVPLVLAAPIAWTALELVRAHLLTGFTYASLGHTQYQWPTIIQAADFAGVYGVSFLVMLLAAGLVGLLPGPDQKMRLAPIALAAIVFTCALAYGSWRLADREALHPGPKVALIQGSIDTTVKSDPNQRFAIYRQYMELSHRAVREQPDVELLVWPETMFREPLITFARDFTPPTSAEWTADDARSAARETSAFIARTARELGAPTILGLDRQHLARGLIQHFNSAIYVDKSGEILGRYEKVHPVMFGEYIPFGDRLRWLYGVTPLAAGLTPGPGPQSFQVGEYRVSPNICFENVLPHLIRGQVNALRSRGQEPDVLINLTNDGWFFGSSELDLHLMCAVFRAVEMRKPFLIAANTGFSAVIESTGRLLAKGPRRSTAVVSAPVSVDRRRSFYAAWGDVIAGTCLALCGVLAVNAAAARIRRPSIAVGSAGADLP